MLDLQESRTGGAGWLPTTPSNVDQVMSVLEGHSAEDSRHRNACQWALALFDYPDFIEDMPVDAKRQLLELVASAKGARYEAIRNHVIDLVDVILEED